MVRAMFKTGAAFAQMYSGPRLPDHPRCHAFGPASAGAAGFAFVTEQAPRGGARSRLVEEINDQRIELPRALEMNRMRTGGHDREIAAGNSPP